MVMDVGVCVLWSLFADDGDLLGTSLDCNSTNQGLDRKQER